MEARSRYACATLGRAWVVLVALALPALLAGAGAGSGSVGASHRTTNFAVEAPTLEIARQVAERAEQCRESIARAWLGEPLAPWPVPCPIRVRITRGEAGGVTSFSFAGGRVSDQEMTVEGRLDRILASALPHEVTHTIFAAYLGGPMPRWADEGASLLSEDGVEHRRHDRIVDELLVRRGDLALGRLFRVEDYPRDLMGFYGQGYSVSRFLVEMGGRPRFLRFVKDGMAQPGWDTAAHRHYGLDDVHELDRAWRSWHRVNAETIASRDDPEDGPAVVRGQSSGIGER